MLHAPRTSRANLRALESRFLPLYDRDLTPEARAEAQALAGIAASSGIEPRRADRKTIARFFSGLPDSLVARSPGATVAARKKAARARKKEVLARLTTRLGILDHREAYLRDGVPFSITAHPKRAPRPEEMQDLRFLALHWGMKLQISKPEACRSWRLPATAHVVELVVPGLDRPFCRPPWPAAR